MKINIAHIGSNDWFNFKSDIISGLNSALSSLGHDVIVTHNRVDDKRFNIVVGADWIQSAELLKVFRGLSVGFAIIEIEHLWNGSLNGRSEFNLEMYMDLARSSKFIFSPYSANRQQYEKHGLGDKFISFKWGFYPELIDLRYNNVVQKTYKCCFVGMLKGSRRKLAEAFSRRYGENFQLVTTTDPFCLKDFKLMQSHWALSLKDEADPVVSVNPFRIFHHSANGVPVLCNHTGDPDGYSDFALYQPSETIVEFADRQSDEFVKHYRELVLSSSLSQNLNVIF